jgi:hypothetical protein
MTVLSWRDGLHKGQKCELCSRFLGWPGSWPEGPRSDGRGGKVAKRPHALAGGVGGEGGGAAW